MKIMENNDNGEGVKCELEDHFIMRLPQKYAEDVHKVLRKKPKRLKKVLFLDVDPETRNGSVIVNKTKLEAKLMNLPTIIESYKTVDKTNLFKTADISQVLLCQEQSFTDSQMKRYKPKAPQIDGGKNQGRKYEWPHGVTPPMKNIKKYRFRKTLKNKDSLQEAAEIEKEIIYLLRMDFEAVSTKFEILYEEPKAVDKNINEHYIFGDVISDSNSDQDSNNSDINDIIEYTN